MSLSVFFCLSPSLPLSLSLPVSRCLSAAGVEELCSKRDELNVQIHQEEEEKARLQHDIHVLTEKLSLVNNSLAQRLAARTTFDRTIAETEAAYMKVCPHETRLN